MREVAIAAENLFEELRALPNDALERILRDADDLDERLQSKWGDQSWPPPRHPLEITFLGALGCRLGMLAGGAGGLLVRMHGTTLLIDPGPGALTRLAILAAAGEFSYGDIDAILCSHLHPDHTSDVLACMEGMMIPLGREPSGVLIGNSTVIERFGALSPYHFRQVRATALSRPGDEVVVGAVTVTAMPTTHVEEAGHAHTGIGFLLSAGNDAAWISSDTTLDAELVAVLERYAEVGAIAIANADASDVERRPGRAEKCHLLTRDIPEICRALRPPAFIVHHYDEAYSSVNYRAAQATYAQRSVDRQSLGSLVLFAGDGLRLSFGDGQLHAAGAVLSARDGVDAAVYATWSRDRAREANS
jgi:glyoxylase-like metal-dependent hydrolase (beta-lactamase superfamily II)